MRVLGGVVVVVTMMSLLGMMRITAARAATVSFLPRADISLGPPGCEPTEECSGVPFALAAGDLDGDGHVDVASANNRSADVTLLLGDGKESLAFGERIAVGDQPAAIATADLDGDHRLDLVIANEAGDSLSVVLATENGFAPAVGVDIGSVPDASDNPPSDVVLADVNGDRKPDAIAVSLLGDKLTVLLNDGRGTLAAPAVTPLAGGPVQLAAGDLDGDRVVDVAVSLNDASSVAVLLGDGNGVFEPVATLEVGGFPTGIVIADFDRDGNADVAVASELSDGVWVLLGTGGGSFADAEDYDVGAAPAALAVADFDGDGRLDLVSADNLGTLELDSSVSVLAGRGDGTFAVARAFATDAGAFDVVAADVNRDRKPDVVTANMERDDVSLLLNTADGPAFACVGDCNVDGVVSIDELVLGVSLSLDPAGLESCPSVDGDGDQRIAVEEVLRAVRGALSGCENDGTLRQS